MFESSVYAKRRNQLKNSISKGLAVILGNPDAPMNYPGNIYPFRQDSSFLYFFGIDQPNFAGVIDFESGEEIIFGNDVDIDDIIWMGPQLSVSEQAKQVAIDKTFGFNKLMGYIEEAHQKGRKIHFLPPYRAENKILIADMLGIHPNETKAKASVELIKAVVNIRSVKDEHEIKHIEYIMDVAYEMHTTAMRMAQPGVYEREVHGKIEGIALSYGGRVSFPVILTKRGETLHNHHHGNKLEAGDLMLVDAGFESSMRYATDHTRTTPVGGKFSSKQKDIYQIVLNANNKATESIKPGITYKEVHLIAAKEVAKGLNELGLMKGNIDEAVQEGAHALFFPHGLGHMMGVDVHDMEDLGEDYVGYNDDLKRCDQFGTAYLRLARKLEPGFVLTNEPGIYFIPALIDKWIKEGVNHQFLNFDKINEYRGFGGIRLEDDILVTENGNRNMGKRRIPITVNEIEEIAGKGL